MSSVIEVLEARGFIDSMTSDEVKEAARKKLTLYVGFDPTSDSLHIGNLVGIMGLAWFQRFGHDVVALVGGSTGMIGDPSGKSIERNLLDPESLEKNLKGIQRSIEAVLGGGKAKILNNHDWFGSIGFVDFLRDVGRHFRVGPMLAKESVRSRLNSEEGMSFTEFSYQLLQAYDFLYLFDHHNVTLQMGGSDQWGNITAGTELVRKARGKTVHGLTFPLITRSDGKKFGKTEEGAIWLNADKLSPYDFYQYMFNMPDADVGKLLRMLTFLDLEEIKGIEADMQKPDHVPNTPQRRLAEEVTRIVHGEKGLEEAVRITEAAKPGAATSLDRATLEALAHELPTKTLKKSEVVGMKVLDLFVLTGMAASKGEGRRLIQNGGAYLNNEKVEDEHAIIEINSMIGGEFLLLGVGKKKKMIISFEKKA